MSCQNLKKIWFKWLSYRKINISTICWKFVISGEKDEKQYRGKTKRILVPSDIATFKTYFRDWKEGTILS